MLRIWNNPLFGVPLPFKMRGFYWLLAVLMIIVTSCSQYNKVYKSTNQYQKFDRAIYYYNKSDYSRALPLFEQLRDYYVGKDSMEIVYYYTAYCHYGLHEYGYASQFFRDFAENFRKSKKLEEMEYMAVYCKYLIIGSHELDQSETIKTIGELQDFITRHPASQYYNEKCNNHLAELRRKLQLKEYEHVMQYYHMGDYRAAFTLAQIVIKDNPDIEEKEELEFITVKASYLFALNSIESKKKERFLESKGFADDFVKNYTGTKSSRLNDVQSLKQKIEFNLKQIEQ